MGLKRKEKNAISLNKTEEKENTPMWLGGSPPSPASFMGASTSHAITISPVEQRDIVSKKTKKNTRGLRTCILSPHCHFHACGSRSGGGEGEERGGGASGGGGRIMLNVER
jgi:hypothetical protein